MENIAVNDAPEAFCPPVMPPVCDTNDQLKVVPVAITPSTECVGVIVNGTPSQKIRVMAFTYAYGATVITTLNAAPVHPPGEVGVTEKVAVRAMLDVLESVPEITVALVPKFPPVINAPEGKDVQV